MEFPSHFQEFTIYLSFEVERMKDFRPTIYTFARRNNSWKLRRALNFVIIISSTAHTEQQQKLQLFCGLNTFVSSLWEGTHAAKFHKVSHLSTSKQTFDVTFARKNTVALRQSVCLIKQLLNSSRATHEVTITNMFSQRRNFYAEFSRVSIVEILRKTSIA